MELEEGSADFVGMGTTFRAGLISGMQQVEYYGFLMDDRNALTMRWEPFYGFGAMPLLIVNALWPELRIAFTRDVSRSQKWEDGIFGQFERLIQNER